MTREALIISLAVAGLASPGAAAPPNFEEHVAPILEVWCVDCHRGSRGRNGVALQDHAATMKGGSGGAIVVPGDPGSSILYLVASHERDPVMPPDGDRMGEEELAILRDWIAGGCRADADDEGSGPKVAAMAAIPRPAAGTTIMPGPSLSAEPYWHHGRSDAVIALAASPTSPLLAIGGHRQVTLASIEDGRPLACLPFPEGTVHDLRFSLDGGLLVIGGGRDGASGVAALVDVASGARLRTFGGEPDAVLSADLSPDGSMLALGGPDGVVRVIDVADGRDLHRLTPHTDWITAVRFSPDGTMLATADRAGGAFVWEAWTGRAFHRLPGRGGPGTACAGRADSNLVGVATDLGPVAVFELERGERIANQSLHDGVLAAAFLPDGRLLTAGRDGRARIGDVGGGETAGWPSLGDLATAVAASGDGTVVAIGGLDGIVRLQAVGESAPRATMAADPPLIEVSRLADAEAAMAAAEAAVPDAERAAGVANDDLLTAQDAAKHAVADLARTRARHVEASGLLADARSAVSAIEAAMAEPTRRLNDVVADRDEMRTRLVTLDAEAERRTAEMRQAVERLAALETASVLQQGDADPGAIEAARRLAEGATALAQRAVAEAGDARATLLAIEIRENAWRSGIESRRPALAAARAAEAAARAEVDEIAAALAGDEAIAAAAIAAADAATTAAVGARDGLARVRAETAARQAAVVAAREALDRRRADVAAANGRVREPAE